MKSIAGYLGVHLGVRDEAMLSKKGKFVDKELTSFEQLQSFMEKRSAAWEARRHTTAQAFLDGFVRQNIAEIDEIPFIDECVPVSKYVAATVVYQMCANVYNIHCVYTQVYTKVYKCPFKYDVCMDI